MTRAPLPIAARAGREAVTGGGFSLTEARYGSARSERRHSHRHDLVAFALTGSATLGWDRTREECPSLSLSIVPAGADHSHAVSEGCRCLILECGPGGLAGETRQALFGQPRVVESGGAAAFGLELNREFRAADDLSPLAIESLLLRLMAGFGRDPESHGEPGTPPWLRRVRDRLHAEFRGRIRIADLAAEADVHPVYLVRAFRRRFGVPPATYLRQLRVAAAARLLVDSTTRLSEVAGRTGFSDQSQLTRHFGRAAGQSPGAFRTTVRS